MDPYSFLRNLDSRAPFLDGLNPLSTLSGLGLELPLPTDVGGKSKVAREETALEANIVQKIQCGEWESLQPNSGKTISLGDHQICVAFHDDKESGYRIWEWHGHLLIFDEEDGYSPEYMFGNHFQSLDMMLHDDDAHVHTHDLDDDADRHALCDGVASLGLGSILPLDKMNPQRQEFLFQQVNVLHRTGNTEAKARKT